MRGSFASANEHYAKINAKKYKAQGVERKELNAKAQKAPRQPPPPLFSSFHARRA